MQAINATSGERTERETDSDRRARGVGRSSHSAACDRMNACSLRPRHRQCASN